jgi:hypothetical protein
VRRRSILDTPELNVTIFALLLNFPWEVLQAPLIDGMAQAPHWLAIKACGVATIGDALIELIAFWSVAAAGQDRRWILRPSGVQVVCFVAIGLAITVIGERLATGPLNRWTYAPIMPVIPLLRLGLAPILQWLALPPFVIWFVHRQLARA